MTRAADVANFTSGIGSASSPTTIGAGFTVTNSGEVRVGGALTASNLNVTGVATFTQSNPTNLSVSGIATVITEFDVGVGATVFTAISSSGFIGVKTASPSQPFQISSGTNIVVVDNQGDLGIGTTNPTSKLHVIGDALIGSLVKVGSGITIDGGSGIISATSLYVNGAPFSSGVGISTLGGTVGTGATILDFRGAGISTITVSAGIATINITGGGSGGSSQWVTTAAGIHTLSNVGIGTTSPIVALDINGRTNLKSYSETYTTSSISSGTLTLDLSLGSVFNISLNANITSIAFSNVQSSKATSITLFFTSDGTTRTINWGTIKWPSATAPSFTYTNGKINIVSLMTNDGGTNWFGFDAGGNY